VTSASARRGVTLQLTLSGAAVVSVKVERLPSRRGRRAVKIGTVRLRAKAGRTRITFRTVAGKRLVRGARYRLTLTVSGAPRSARPRVLVVTAGR
jgi:hypothetical protein